MILKFHKPVGQLREYIALITYYESRTAVHNIERLLPDGSVNILIDLTDTPKYIFDNDLLQEKQTCNRSWVSGMHSNYISIGAAKNACMVVIRFLPGKSYPFLKLPIYELNNQVVDGDLIFGSRIHSLREAVGEMNSIEEKFQVVENWLQSIGRYQQNNEAIISYAVENINKYSSSLCLGDLAFKSGYSQKQFISIFKKHLGLSPKMYHRIVRFNKVLVEIETKNSIHWTKLCYDLNYHDQAHFIKEFRQFAGFNPNQFLKERGEFINYVPVG
jgi:AraC-like DNA-binding protein